MPMTDNRLMATGMVAALRCATCGSPSALVELVAPGGLPAEWERWSDDEKDAFRQYRDPDQWWLLFEGIAAGNGDGNAITADKAARIAEAFAMPCTYDRVHAAGLYDDAGFCGTCSVPYCYRHWHVTRSGLRLLPGRSRQEPRPALVPRRLRHMTVMARHMRAARSLPGFPASMPGPPPGS